MLDRFNHGGVGATLRLFHRNERASFGIAADLMLRLLSRHLRYLNMFRFNLKLTPFGVLDLIA